MKELVPIAIKASERFPGFDHNSLEGELTRLRLFRELRRSAPGHAAAEYDWAIKRAGDFVHAERRARGVAA